MTAKTILFPTDFSSSSDAGLKYATSLARDWNARLLILHVEEPPPAYAGGMYYGPPMPERPHLEEMLGRVVPPDPDVPYEHRYEVGHPAEVICDVAREAKVDCIVMGTHGRTGFERLLLGSIAEHVVREAPCPVLTLKGTEEEAQQ